MAVTARRLPAGAWELIGLRWLALLACLAPTYMAARNALGSGVGLLPAVSEASERALPLGLTAELLKQAGAEAAPFALLGLLLFVWIDWGLTAAACEPGAPGKPALRRALDGLTRAGAMARLGLIHTTALGLATAALGALGDVLWQRLERAQWTAGAELLWIPTGQVALGTLLGALLGALNLSGQVLIARDGRRRARRVALETLRLWARGARRLWPLLLLPALLQVLGAGLLLPLIPPQTSLLGDAFWALYLGVHCLAWYWLLQHTAVVYAAPRFDDIRRRGDRPLGLRRRLFRLAQRRAPRPTRPDG